MEPRKSGDISLRPSGNEQGGHYFLSLHTGKRILRNHWTILPMPNDVVDALHRLAVASKQARGITFMDKDGNILIDDDDKEIEEAMEMMNQYQSQTTTMKTSSMMIEKK